MEDSKLFEWKGQAPAKWTTNRKHVLPVNSSYVGVKEKVFSGKLIQKIIRKFYLQKEESIFLPKLQRLILGLKE